MGRWGHICVQPSGRNELGPPAPPTPPQASCSWMRDVGCGMQAPEGQSSKQGTARLRDSELNPLVEPLPEHSALGREAAETDSGLGGGMGLLS